MSSPRRGGGGWRAVLAFTLLPGGCDPEPPRAIHYGHACTGDEDCVVVMQEWPCGCSCPNLVCLPADEAERFEADQASWYDHHPCDSFCMLGCPAEPRAVSCACVRSSCRTQAPDPTGSPE